MFGISKTLKLILSKLSDLKQQLTYTSGSVYETEGIVKKILTLVRTIAVELPKISESVSKILEVVSSEVEEDESDFFFSQFKVDNIIIEGRLEKVTMNEFQQVTGTFKALKRNKKEAKVENARVEVDQPDKATAELIGENQVRVRAVEGQITEPVAILVTVTADADLDVGETREISIVGSLTITPGEAESLEMEFGEPEDIPTEQPNPNPEA